MSETYYIASCVFTSRFPALSARIRSYIAQNKRIHQVRCCVPRYKLSEFTSKMPEGTHRQSWNDLPDSASFEAGNLVYSLCHNCNNIIEEMHPGAEVHSLWELIDADDSFVFPDYTGLHVTLQDCWRSRDRCEEQKAVRSLLTKMRISWDEHPENHAQTRFCGNSLYRPQPPRNPKLAPHHYAEGTEGLFLPHTMEEQKKLMEKYCSDYKTDTVVCYCHYCLEGILLGGKDGKHLAELIFCES